MSMSVRVLLIDDHDDARTTLARRLRRDSRLDLVGVAASVQDAAGLLSDSHPEVVLLDVHGHDGQAAEACRALRRLTDVPVIVFASFMTANLVTAVREAGAADYVLKHVDTDRLSQEIARAAQHFRAGVTGRDRDSDTAGA